MDIKQDGEERVDSAYTSTLVLVIKGSQDRKLKQGRILEAGDGAKAMEGGCLLACFP